VLSRRSSWRSSTHNSVEPRPRRCTGRRQAPCAASVERAYRPAGPPPLPRIERHARRLRRALPHVKPLDHHRTLAARAARRLGDEPRFQVEGSRGASAHLTRESPPGQGRSIRRRRRQKPRVAGALLDELVVVHAPLAVTALRASLARARMAGLDPPRRARPGHWVHAAARGHGRGRADARCMTIPCSPAARSACASTSGGKPEPGALHPQVAGRVRRPKQELLARNTRATIARRGR